MRLGNVAYDVLLDRNMRLITEKSAETEKVNVLKKQLSEVNARLVVERNARLKLKRSLPQSGNSSMLTSPALSFIDEGSGRQRKISGLNIGDGLEVKLQE